MNRPLVSVIVPVYNGERYLRAALESIFEQDYQPCEVIVVDDGSTDHSADIIGSYQEIHSIYQSNQGVAAARNAGIAAAHGEFIAFLDADDVWMSHKLSVQIDHLLQHPCIGCIVARMRVLLEPGTAWPASFNKDYYSQDPVGFIPSTLVVRKPVFEHIGTFDPSYRTGEDSDWFFRAKDAGIRMAILPEVLVYKRIHRSNLSYHALPSEILRVVKSSIDRQYIQRSAKESQDP